MVVPPAYKSARKVAILFAFPYSGTDYLLSRLKSHTRLFVCENLCLLPFTNLEERKLALYGADWNDGLVDALETLRNRKERADLSEFFDSTASAYRAVQEWCAPQVLVDGTEAYSAATRRSFSAAFGLFVDASLVHLLRNPRCIFGEYSHDLNTDHIVEFENKYNEFTKEMIGIGGSKARSLLEIRYEDLKAGKRDILDALL